MTATATPRSQVRAAIIDRLSRHPALTGVQIARQIPADIAAEHVLLANIEGTMQLRTIKAGRKQREDRFTITVYIGAMRAGQTAEQAENRAAAFLAALEDVLANDATLTGVDGVQQINLGRVLGPDVETNTEGHIGTAVADVDVVAFLN